MALLKAFETGMKACSDTHGDGVVYLECLSIVRVPVAAESHSKNKAVSHDNLPYILS